eukprot:1065190-Pelagomonas_calceolata.AAC.1
MPSIGGSHWEALFLMHAGKDRKARVLSLLPVLPSPPPHTMCYAAGTAPHIGPTQLPALDNPIN